MNICMVRHEQHTLQGGHLSLKLFKQLDKTFVHIHIDLVISASCNFFFANKIFHPDRLKFSYLPRVSAAKYKMCYKPNEMDYAWPEIWAHWHLHIAPGIIYRATTPGTERWKGDSEMNSPGVQRNLSTQIHSKLFCGAQLSAQPAELLGTWLSHGSTSTQLFKQLCGLCQRSDTPEIHSPKTFTAWKSAGPITDAHFLLNNQALNLQKGSFVILGS